MVRCEKKVPKVTNENGLADSTERPPSNKIKLTNFDWERKNCIKTAECMTVGELFRWISEGLRFN